MTTRGRPEASVQAVPATQGFLTRARRVVREEVGQINLRLLIANFLISLLPELSLCRLRTTIYRLAGFQIGRGTVILGKIRFSGIGKIQRRLYIGEYCRINSDVFIDLTGTVHIGNNIAIGHHLVLVTTNHFVGPSSYRCGPGRPGRVSLGDGCWIAACVTLLPGVAVGAGSIVGAGSLVSKDVPPDTVVMGVPAAPIKSLKPRQQG